MITGTLLSRKTSDDPPICLVVFDDGTGPLGVGSISEIMRHTRKNERYWRWGIDIMPMMDHGGHVPSGETWSREAALQAFKGAFFQWLEDHADEWPTNRDFIKASLVGRK